MNWLEALVLGLIQGLTEFLPISSTGHLYLGRHAFGLDEAGLFLDTMLHIGTLVAVLWVYKEELLQMLRKPFGKMTLLLVVGNIPTAVVGFTLLDYFEEISKSGSTIGWEFLITGTFLWFAETIRHGRKKMEDISYTDALVIGAFQAAAISPAISRSGMTIVGALLRKLDRKTAAYFSFLLSIPAIGGAVLFQSKELLTGSAENISAFPLMIGMLASGLFGYLAIRWMIRYLQKGSLKAFAVYVWALGLFIVAAQLTGIF